MMRHRVALVASHPVQYQAPWYRALAALVDLQVFFAHRVTPADQVHAGFGVGFEWDVPLLDGYRFEWLENVSARPGVDRFRGCNTPGIGSVLERTRFDAVIVNGWQLQSYWQAIYAARRARIPVMVRGDSQLAAERGGLRRVAKHLSYPYLLKAFDACLTVGRRSHEYLRHYGVPANRLYRSPHCVDNEFFSRAAAAARQDPVGPRRRLRIPPEKIVFVFIGKLTDKKRPLDFLRALDQVRDAGTDVWGLVVGDGPLRETVEDHLRRCSTPCAIAGFLNQQELGAAYAAADALVLPSDGGETWGLVVNEAMASGVPAIVSDQVGCAPDLIVEGVTGFTYPCGNVPRLAERMMRMATDPDARRDMATRSCAHIRGFSPQVAAAGVMDALEGVRVRHASAA